MINERREAQNEMEVVMNILRYLRYINIDG